MFRFRLFAAIVTAASLSFANSLSAAEKPNIILVMADDMGWGQTSYYDHPILKTPNLDAMAASGLRFDRFYAGAPNCSPTRATVMTGRSNDRTAVYNHGHALRRQERTVAQTLQQAGYVTGHFGKWHLNGIRGPGAPVLADDVRNPGRFGFDKWLSVTNFFDMNPLMSREGTFEQFQGDSSEIVVAEALKFVLRQRTSDKPFFAVIWYGTPHSPWVASEEDRAPFADLDDKHQHHYGELVAMDRSIGALRRGLRDLEIAENTLVWFCSDNGGLPGFGPHTVGGLRGWKGSVYEGGLRVPAIIEWPDAIKEPRVTSFPATTMDILPTLADIVGLPESILVQPQDGVSLKGLLAGEIGERIKPIPFRHTNRGALIDNDLKLVAENVKEGTFALYDLENDAQETTDLSATRPDVARRMIAAFQTWNQSVEASIAGKDYPEGRLREPDPEPIRWTDGGAYEQYFGQWKNRPEYQSAIK